MHVVWSKESANWYSQSKDKQPCDLAFRWSGIGLDFGITDPQLVPGGISELRWVLVPKAGSIHVVNSKTHWDKQAKLHCASLSAEVARTQLNNWPKAQVECSAMKSVIDSACPIAPTVSRAVVKEF